ncbi:MAG: zf-HC2 domain-containing protein, partial [Rivularia sp. (in: cyanobacteria)]
MRSCPKYKQLALYIEGKLTFLEARKIRQHLAECQECSHGLASVIELQDLEADGLLPKVTELEIECAFQNLEKLIKQQTETSSVTPKSTKHSTSELKSRLNNFFGGVVAAAGLTKIQGNFDDLIPNPSLGDKDEKNFSSSVRNDHQVSSKLLDDDDAANIKLNQEFETVNNNTYTKFESAPAVIGVPGVDGKSSS